MACVVYADGANGRGGGPERAGIVYSITNTDM